MEHMAESFAFSNSVYKNISNVVNLKCEECHEKLEHFLKSLSIRHKNNHIDPTLPVEKSVQTDSITILELHPRTRSSIIAKKNDSSKDVHSDPMIEPIVPETNSNLEESVVTHVKSQLNLVKIEPDSNLSVEKMNHDAQADSESSTTSQLELQDSSLNVKKVYHEAKADPKSKTSSQLELPDYSEFLPPKNTDTERRANRIFNLFKDFIDKNLQTTFEELVMNKNKLEEQLIHFLHNHRVNDNELPKRSTLEQMRSFIKLEILRQTENKFDIADSVQFPRFCSFYKGYMKKLKMEGKGDKTPLGTPIPKADLVTINQFLVYLHSIMNGTNNDLSRIPQGYEQRYHNLMQKGLIFILFSFYGKKSSSSTYSSIQNGELKVDDFEIVNHPALGQCYTKVDEKEIFIPFRENEHGLNYGQYMHDYLSKLNPTSSWLLTQPQRSTRVFIGNIWFEGNKVGKNAVATAMSDLSAALELPRYINSQISVIKIDATEFEEQDPLAPPADKKIKIEIEDPLFVFPI